MNAFKYHGWGANETAPKTDTPWYDNFMYPDDSTNWFALSQQAADYGYLTLWGVAALT